MIVVNKMMKKMETRLSKMILNKVIKKLKMQLTKIMFTLKKDGYTVFGKQIQRDLAEPPFSTLPKNNDTNISSLEKTIKLFIYKGLITIVTEQMNQKIKQTRVLFKSGQGIAYETTKMKSKLLLKYYFYQGKQRIQKN